MNSTSKNYLIAFLACTTLAGAGLVLQQRQLLAEARAKPTLKITQSNFTPRPAQALEEKKQPEAPVEANADETSAPTAPDAMAGGNPGQRPGQGRGQWAARMTELMKDPEFVAAMKIEQDARIEKRYGSLFKQLNLPADKITALKNLLSERDNARRDVMATSMAQGLDMRDAATRDKLSELSNQMQAEVDTNIKATIGETAYAQLETYKATQAQRSAVSNFNEKLSISGQALTESQSQQLTKILTDTGTVKGRDIGITDQTISAAKGVLMPSQVNQLLEYKAQQDAQKLIQSKMSGGGNGGGRQRGGN
jgi:hypothetical protein